MRTVILYILGAAFLPFSVEANQHVEQLATGLQDFAQRVPQQQTPPPPPPPPQSTSSSKPPPPPPPPPQSGTASNPGSRGSGKSSSKSSGNQPASQQKSFQKQIEDAKLKPVKKDQGDPPSSQEQGSSVQEDIAQQAAKKARNLKETGGPGHSPGKSGEPPQEETEFQRKLRKRREKTGETETVTEGTGG